MDLAEYKGVYVIAEQFEGKLRNVSFELLGQGKNWRKPSEKKWVLY